MRSWQVEAVASRLSGVAATMAAASQERLCLAKLAGSICTQRTRKRTPGSPPRSSGQPSDEVLRWDGSGGAVLVPRVDVRKWVSAQKLKYEYCTARSYVVSGYAVWRRWSAWRRGRCARGVNVPHRASLRRLETAYQISRRAVIMIFTERPTYSFGFEM